MKMNKPPRFPISAQFELTESCPHDCFYCYNHFRESPAIRNPKLEEVIDRIAQSDLFHVTITGGEPLSESNGLNYALDRFRENNIDVTLNSGLTLSTRETLINLKDKGVLSILTSAGSHDSKLYERVTGVPGSFDKFTQALSMCQEVSLPVSVNMVVHNFNKDSVYETGKYFMENFGIHSFCATPLIPPKNRNIGNAIISAQDYVNVLDDLLRLSSDLKISVDSLHPPLPCILPTSEKYSVFLKRSCVGGRGTLTISSVGDVRPCSHSDESYGNILKTDLRKIHLRMIPWQNESLIPSECESCAEVNTCRGGCRVCAEAVYGNIKGKDIFMTSPLTSFLSRVNKQLSRLSPDKKFTLKNSDSVRARIEPSGEYTIYNGLKKVVTLRESEIGLLKEISNLEEFSAMSLSFSTGISLDRISLFLSRLDTIKMLQ